MAAFGSTYVAGYWTLVALTFSQVIRAAFGPSVNVLTTLAAGRKMAIVSTLALAVLAVSNLLLSPYWGALGAAIAVNITVLFWSAALAVLLHRLSGLRTDIVATFFGAERRGRSHFLQPGSVVGGGL